MRPALLLAGLVLAAVPLGAQARPAAAIDPVPCFTDGDVDYVRDHIVSFMVRDDSASAMERDLWRLPRTSPDGIAVVRDLDVCSRVAARYYGDLAGLLPAHGIAVVRVGAHLVALGRRHAGEWTITEVYDPRLRVVARLAQ